ncbi:MAG: hypothetical protein K2Z81_09380 [Cyanobacteria bacterium]|nr:hypothetical protein [Cyanobacteriota bacterium]
MSWPTPQDFNEAIQNPSSCFSDKDLRSGRVKMGPLGLPIPITGAFASVYKVSANGADWAVRCFLTHREEQQDRYKKVSEFVQADELHCTVPFYYLSEGIKVKGTWYPILKMEWINGETLEAYLRKVYRDRKKIEQLIADFRKLAGDLDAAGIAHGDLQHGNIIVTGKGLQLVDYDALFVPALKGAKSLEIGHPNYQHPARNEHHYDIMVDNFSCWLIYYSLMAIAVDPGLFELYGGDECILFKRVDLVEPEQSVLFQSMKNHADASVKTAAEFLIRMLSCAPEFIPELSVPEKDALDLLLAQSTPALLSGSADLTDFPLKIQATVPAISSGSALNQTRTRPNRQSAILKQTGAVIGSVFRAVDPTTWIKLKVGMADYEFRAGRYNDALPHLQELIKNEKILLNDSEFRDEYLNSLIRIGYCYGCLGQHNLAHNYFLEAFNTKKAAQHIGKSSLERCALLLAVSHYILGQKDSACSVILKTDGLISNLGSLVDLEHKQGSIRRESVFELLVDVIDSSSAKYKHISIENRIRIFESAFAIYKFLEKTESAKLDRLAFELFVDSADCLISRTGKVSSKWLVDQMQTACISICNKEGLDTSQSYVWTFKDMVKIAGLSVDKSKFYEASLEWLEFERSCRFKIPPLSEREILDRLEKLSPDAITKFVLCSLAVEPSLRLRKFVRALNPLYHRRSYDLVLVTASRFCDDTDYGGIVERTIERVKRKVDYS